MYLLAPTRTAAAAAPSGGNLIEKLFSDSTLKNMGAPGACRLAATMKLAEFGTLTRADLQTLKILAFLGLFCNGILLA
jgi:hypothetical protein